MHSSKLIVFFIIMASCFSLSAQTEEVRIKITGQSDLIYNGKSLQILNPNLAVGQDAGASLNSNSFDNTLFGKTAGKSITSGRANTFVGNSAGYNNNGSLNVFIGNEAGMNEEGDDKLYISNSSSGSPLIHGDFRTREVTINDFLNVNKDLDVAGSGEMSSLALFSTNPTLKFKSGSTTPFSIQYNSGAGDLSITEAGVAGDVLSINEGIISLPQYTGSGEEAIYADTDGKLVRKVKVNMTLNKYNFFEPVQYSGAVRYRLGVQLPDGITIHGLKAYVLDNEPGTNTGIQNTPFYFA